MLDCVSANCFAWGWSYPFTTWNGKSLTKLSGIYYNMLSGSELSRKCITVSPMGTSGSSVNFKALNSLF